MKTAASYIKKKYDCYKGYSEKSIRDVCHIWCEVIEEAQNDVKKEYEEKLRWIPIEEELPTIHVDVILKCESGFWDKGCLIHQSGDNMFSSSSGDLDIVTHWRPISFL